MNSLILKICEHCRYKYTSHASLPCRECSSRDKWEIAESIIVSTKKLEAQQQEIGNYFNIVAEDNAHMKKLYSAIEALQQMNNELRTEFETTKRIANEQTEAAIDLQQENEQLQDENISIKNWTACETEQFSELLESDKRRIELEEEIEQLQAQNGAMAEALKAIKGLELEKNHESVTYNIANNALSTSPTTYHNPADAEEIEQLEYTLLGVMHSVDKWFDEVDESVDEVNRAAQAREIALQAIEKRDEALKQAREALGGIIKTYEDDFAIEGLEGLCPRENAILNYYTRPALAAIDKVVGEC